MDILAQLESARLAGVPIVAITCADPGATALSIAQQYQKEPVFKWRISEGITAMTTKAEDKIPSGHGSQDGFARNTREPELMLFEAARLPNRSVLLAMNLHLSIRPQSPDYHKVSQALWDLRDLYKDDSHRMIIILSCQIQLSPELQRDIMVFDEELPNEEQLAEQLKQFIKDNPTKQTDSEKKQIVTALRGLSPYEAENAIALAYDSKKKEISIPMVWERKRVQIKQTPGLSYGASPFTFDDVGGLEGIKRFFTRLANGPHPFDLLVDIDEVEKMMGGGGAGQTTSSGSNPTSDALAVTLQCMQNYNWYGVLAVGIPGGGKSFVSQTAAATFRKPWISLDYGALKGSYVGESEDRVRNAMKMLHAIGGEQVFFYAACNGDESLPPEFVDRFTFGTYFFDVASPEELPSIWAANMRRFQIPEQKMPDDTGWTGRNIRNCCAFAWQLGCSLIEASEQIIPILRSRPQVVERLRDKANGQYLSASGRGVYMTPESREKQERTGNRKVMNHLDS